MDHRPKFLGGHVASFGGAYPNKIALSDPGANLGLGGSVAVGAGAGSGGGAFILAWCAAAARLARTKSAPYFGTKRPALASRSKNRK